MRIIAGTHRGRKILSPEGDKVTRPITDRVKQSLFDRLAAAGRLEGAVVLDVFSGTGSLGLECLSRDAAHVTFVELDRAVLKLLEENLAAIREQAKARILRSSALSGAMVASLPQKQYNLIFVDPPYAMAADESTAPRLWQQVEQLSTIAAPDAWLVLRVEEHQEVPPIAHWPTPESFRYGSMTVHIYRRDTTPADSVDGAK